MIDRRSLLAGSATAAVSIALGGAKVRAAEPQTLRIASLKFGSLSWLLETMKAEGLDSKAGLKLDVFEVASNQAGPIALVSGDCDVMVSDWPWAMRQRALGEMVRFSPFSSSLGAVMVPKGSPAKSLADLAGKKIGVAAPPSTKLASASAPTPRRRWARTSPRRRDAGVRCRAAADLADPVRPARCGALISGRMPRVSRCWATRR